MNRGRALSLLAASSLFGLAACGGSSAERSLDESDDLAESSGGAAPAMAPHIVDMPTGLGGTEWRFVSASCTEGPLDLSARGFSSHLRIAESGPSLLLTYDQAFAAEGCEQTVVQRVSPPATPGELDLVEVARVAVPSTAACFGQPEAPRPGEVRRNGRSLEILVQRSRWCGGFEVRFVYEPEMPRMLGEGEFVRHYAVAFSLGDADALAGMFAPTGSLLEPFTRTTTGDPYRHDGREAVRAWYREAFEGTEWRALRILGIEHASDTQLNLMWEYMDSRLAAPVDGRNVFTVAAGEIFESQVFLDGTPVLAPPPAAP